MELGYTVSNEWNGFSRSYYCGSCLDTSTGVEEFTADDASNSTSGRVKCIYCGVYLYTYEERQAERERDATTEEIMDDALGRAYSVGYYFGVKDWTGSVCASFLTVREARAYINEWDSDSRDRMSIHPYHGDGSAISRMALEMVTRKARATGNDRGACGSTHAYMGHSAACILDNGHDGQHEDIGSVRWGWNR